VSGVNPLVTTVQSAEYATAITNRMKNAILIAEVFVEGFFFRLRDACMLLILLLSP
jgi:hypothetical protein